jgi:hypothetical protein
MKDNIRFITKGFSGFNLLMAKAHSDTCKGHPGAWLIVMLLVVLIVGCNGNTSLDSEPAVTLTVPAADATDAATNTNISVVFTEEMDSSTINSTTFTLKQGTTDVPGAVTYSGLTATFDPTIDLEAFTTYTAMITTGAENPVGTALASDYVWSFTTGAAPDTTKPTVTLTVPADGDTGVAINTQIAAAFSEEMDPSTINNTTFTLKQGSTNVPGTVTYSGSAVFTPTGNLLQSTIYTATITSAAKDLVGNELASNYVWSFTTVAAGDLNVSPTTLTYDNRTVGTTSTNQTVTISNTGGSVLTVNSITNSNSSDFVLGSVPATPFAMNAGAIQTFTVAFKPAEIGARSATITIASTAGNAIVSAIGTGVAAAAALSVLPATLTYTDTAVGTTSTTKTVTISNLGSTALTVNSITNSNITDFDLGSVPATPLTINAGASQTFTVAFSPADTGLKEATITVVSGVGNATVTASGTGIAAP